MENYTDDKLFNQYTEYVIYTIDFSSLWLSFSHNLFLSITPFFSLNHLIYI